VVALRSRALTNLSGQGGMVWVGLPLAEVYAALADVPDVEIAAVNGPGSIVISGTPAALDQLVARWQSQDIRVRRLAVDYASHSDAVDTLHEMLTVACSEGEHTAL